MSGEIYLPDYLRHHADEQVRYGADMIETLIQQKKDLMVAHEKSQAQLATAVEALKQCRDRIEYLEKYGFEYDPSLKKANEALAEIERLRS